MTSPQFNEHMPIGLHVAVGGNMQGAGQPDGYWVQLAKAGKKPVVKSVNNYGPIQEAMRYCDQYNVEGVFVFRIAGIDDSGFNFDVPAWSVDPQTAADFHIQKILQVLPPEFDKRVWLEIINEPDKDSDDKKPDWTSKEFAQWLSSFGVAASTELMSLGFKVSMFGFSSGEPELTDWYEYEPFFELVAQNHDRLAIALHEYSYSNDLTDPRHPYPFLLGRFQIILNIFDEMELRRPKIHITEFGWTLWDVANPTDAKFQFLDVLQNIYGNFPEVEMLALWYFGPEFNNIADKAVNLIPVITELGLTWKHEITNPTPPTPEPPAEPEPPAGKLDLASFFIPRDKIEYGPIYMIGNNWGEGPERTQTQLKNHMGNNLRRFSYITKNGNWERRYIGDKYIHLQVDTSRSAEEWYKVDGPWLPRHMTPGEIFHRMEKVTVYSKDTCQSLHDYPFNSAIQFNGLMWEPSPIPGMSLLCAKFTWLIGPDQIPEESYWYAQGIGLVRWYRHRDKAESRITEFVPDNEHNNPVIFECEEMKEWISELPTEPTPPPLEPPTEPTPEYLLYPRGIDISHWQGNFNPEKAMQEGANFVYCKATQGTSHVDRRYLEYIEQADNYGLLTGSYHFFDPRLDGALQAEHFVNIVEQSASQHLPPALDLERLEGADIIDPIAYRKNVLAFLQICEDKLITPIIYTNKAWYIKYLSTPDFDKYDLWIASWTNGTLPYLPIRNQDWLFWQFGVRDGEDYGVDSNTIDVNYSDFDSIEELYSVFSQNWLKKEPAPIPTPHYYPAPRREDYPRTCLVIYDGMTEAQKDSVWEMAKTLKQTIMFSYDDAGSTPVTDNTAILYGIPTALHDKYELWFKTHYPNTNILFKGGSFYERQPGQNEVAKPKEGGDVGVVSRLRRALVRLQA